MNQKNNLGPPSWHRICTNCLSASQHRQGAHIPHAPGCCSSVSGAGHSRGFGSHSCAAPRTPSHPCRNAGRFLRQGHQPASIATRWDISAQAALKKATSAFTPQLPGSQAQLFANQAVPQHSMASSNPRAASSMDGEHPTYPTTGLTLLPTSHH